MPADALAGLCITTMLYSSRPTALPARFRKPRLLIVGCGDVGLRVARLMHGRVRVLALSSQPAERAIALRAAGVDAVLGGDLDARRSLFRLAGLAQYVLHLAPPPGEGADDPRTRALVQAMSRRSRPQVLVYGSTSGVYGDCAGAWVREPRPTAPATARARRRVAAEQAIAQFGRTGPTTVAVLRIPGIYALDREGGTPRARIERQTPVLVASDDVHTNHIHADDLACACVLALWRARPQRTYHVSDDTQMAMGDYFDLAADLFGLPRPPRITRHEAQAMIAAPLLSFMSESRRLDNTRLKRELGLRLRYPTVAEGLRVQA